MIKFLPLVFFSVSPRIPWENKNTVYRLQISALVPEIFKLEKWVKYASEMADDVIHSTQYYVQYINRATSANFVVQNIETWQVNSSMGNTPVTIKNSVSTATHSFPVPTHLISISWWFSAWKCNTRPQSWANIFRGLLDHAYEVLLANIKMEWQRWPEKLLIWGVLEPRILPW